ncbi:hypothetical protein K474DRAFT_1710183 [Panus rudis PR-1116 ss-1]|nr:hypothetical protein K474DRAFT_1710183 [Panus rudis PR-1116 ss-1]
MDSNPSHVSCIGIVDFTEDVNWVYISESVQDLLGFEPRELVGRSALELAHPDEFPQLRRLHYDTIKQDKAAALVYTRLRHKDPCKGYILCAVTRTVCQNVLVGSVSFAAPGPRAMHNNATAQEVTVITPSAKDFEFRKWNEPSPMPPCDIPVNMRPDSRPSTADSSRSRRSPPLSFAPLPEQSVRTALILDRFSERCGILYCANDSILPTTQVLGRSFFDFVVSRDEDLVRSWIDTVKGWGVNERGQPSDGGFGFGKFSVCVKGRNSSPVPEPPPSRRHGGASTHTSSRDRSRNHNYRNNGPVPHREYTRPAAPGEELRVDAIFSAHSDGLMVILRRAY